MARTGRWCATHFVGCAATVPKALEQVAASILASKHFWSASPLLAPGILGAAHTTRSRANGRRRRRSLCRNSAPSASRVSASAAKASSRVDEAMSVMVWV